MTAREMMLMFLKTEISLVLTTMLLEVLRPMQRLAFKAPSFKVNVAQHLQKVEKIPICTMTALKKLSPTLSLLMWNRGY
jgi:hypothetical protein